MSQPAEFSVAEPAVLGVSVLGEEIAMVVRDATGDIVASNLVELTDGAPASAAAAFADLVESAPFRVADIVIACARDDVRAHLESVMHGPSAPAWASSVGFVDLPSVLAQAARREADGVVVAVALDGSGAVAAGRTIALVDASHGTAVEALEVPVGQQVPVTYPEGLQPLADYLAASSVPRVVCVGSGADTPGVVGAIESAGVRVTVVPAPVFALAQGTTQLLATTTHRITPAVGAAAPVPVAAVAAAVPPGAAPTAPADPALPGHRADHEFCARTDRLRPAVVGDRWCGRRRRPGLPDRAGGTVHRRRRDQSGRHHLHRDRSGYDGAGHGHPHGGR
nr:hypothetical protein [Gordonia sp. NB41Y]